MRAFIVRPFGKKAGNDFERVERELIQPALRQLGESDVQIAGSTTGLINRQGNIREDMFRLIAISDLVIADISIHNANVFYELGMRHALKPRHTFIIRCKGGHDHPFDLETDRYFSYDATRPEASVNGLARALRSSLASPSRSDSPMFDLLPHLVPHGRRQLVKVPAAFAEDVDHARRTREYGMLRLLAHEAASFEWDQEGLQLVGDAQFKMRAFFGARDTFELLRRADSAHVHANLRLGTIYQRLQQHAPAERRAELMSRSAQALQRVLAASPARSDLVEAHCLLASNEKSRWIEQLAGLPQEQQQRLTLQSPDFDSMLSEYLRAANLDLNAHYPAINALAGLQIRAKCARALPEEWRDQHADDGAAEQALNAIDKLIGHLVSTLHLALELDALMGERPGEPDPWVASSRADFMLLTEPTRIPRVRQCYQKALKGDDWFALEAIRRNLSIYKGLGVFEPGVGVALEEVDSAIAKGGKPPARHGKVLVFTGHMVDGPDRPAAQARFPNTPEAAAQARAMIRAAVQAEIDDSRGDVLGIAGGACGGDILFHEVCAELGVPTALYLAMQADQYQVSSVQHGGPDWEKRYRKIVEQHTPHVLQPGKGLPSWLTDKPGYNIWERCNLWMIFSAMSVGANDLSLLALYNSEREPDGPGGTAHLIEEAKKRGFRAVELDARELLVP